ncbi:hypothetical protein, partial [Brevibacterium paucivorans]|uniref:hypothetical protein n=1 Tax=Brevibacterium paucivorans TaxID=170994 RepID=UPI001CA5ED72
GTASFQPSAVGCSEYVFFLRAERTTVISPLRSIRSTSAAVMVPIQAERPTENKVKRTCPGCDEHHLLKSNRFQKFMR